MQRISIPDFALANPIYVGARVSFYLADASGNKTATLATLYDAKTGSDTLSNPQELDSAGKFSAPVYIDAAVIGAVDNANGVPDHDTGVIGRVGELSGSKDFDPGSIAADGTEQTDITVTDAAVDDFALGSFSLSHNDIVIFARVISANTVRLTFWNRGASAVNLASGTAYARVLKR